MDAARRVKLWSTVAFIVFLLCILIPEGLIHKNHFPAAFIALCIALIVFCLTVGLAINGQAGGLIIDSRNRMSLSKLQAVAWTIVVLSGWATFVLVRLHLSAEVGAAEVNIPGELLAAMGISAASLAATPVLLDLKPTDPSNQAQAQNVATKIGDKREDVADAGGVYARNNAAAAQWLDLFRGDEVGNAASADLSKMQHFLITVIILIVYAGSLLHLLHGATKADSLNTLPPLGENFVWLIGISHAGYLAYKAAPHPGVAPGSTGNAPEDGLAHG